jgi:hypothetical protein
MNTWDILDEESAHCKVPSTTQRNSIHENRWLTAMFIRVCQWTICLSLVGLFNEGFDSSNYIALKDGIIYIKKKSRYTPWSAWGERRYSSYSFTTSALDEGEWSASRPGRALQPGKGPPVPIGQEEGGDPEPVWTQRLEEKILCPCRGSNPDRPVVQPVVRHYTAWAIPAPGIIYIEELTGNYIEARGHGLSWGTITWGTGEKYENFSTDNRCPGLDYVAHF